MSVIFMSGQAPLEINFLDWGVIVYYSPDEKRFIRVLQKINSKHVIVHAEDNEHNKYAGVYINHDVDSNDSSVVNAIINVSVTMNRHRENMTDWDAMAMCCINQLPPIPV